MIENKHKKAQQFPSSSSKNKSKKFFDAEYEKMKATILREIGNRLTELREKHNLNQSEMLRKFNGSTPLTPSGYSHWETGTSKLDIIFLRQLHDEWRVDLNWLIAGDEHFTPDLPVEVQEAIRILEEYKQKCIFRN